MVKYSYNKIQRDALISRIFGIELYMFRTGFSFHHQESSTVHTTMGICHTSYLDCMLASSGSVLIPLASSQHNLYDIDLLLCIQY